MPTPANLPGLDVNAVALNNLPNSLEMCNNAPFEPEAMAVPVPPI